MVGYSPRRRSRIFYRLVFRLGNSGEVLGHTLLGRLADFRIDLSVDVYPTAVED